MLPIVANLNTVVIYCSNLTLENLGNGNFCSNFYNIGTWGQSYKNDTDFSSVKMLQSITMVFDTTVFEIPSFCVIKQYQVGNCNKFYFIFEFEYRLWFQIFQKFEKHRTFLPFVKLVKSEYR